jgi:hypothetical protein
MHLRAGGYDDTTIILLAQSLTGLCKSLTIFNSNV